MNFLETAQLLGTALVFITFFFTVNYGELSNLLSLEANKLSGNKAYEKRFSNFIKKWIFMVLLPVVIFDSIIILEIIRKFSVVVKFNLSFPYLFCCSEVLVFLLFTIYAVLSLVNLEKQRRLI